MYIHTHIPERSYRFAGAGATSPAAGGAASAAGDDHKDEQPSGSGTLMPVPNLQGMKPNLTLLVFEIDRIGLKDAQTYLDAMITITVVDSKGFVPFSHIV